MTTDHLIGTADAAQRLGVDRSTLVRWVAAGRVEPTLRVPGYRGAFLFAPDDLAALASEDGNA